MRTCLKAILLLTALGGCDSSSTSVPDPAAQREFEEGIATLINLNGHLCARVDYISPQTSTGEYQVVCEEYRNPQKARTARNLIVYMVNMESGAARLMGRR